MYEKFANLLSERGVTAYRVSFTDWKNGRSNPKFDKLLILAKYFDVPVEYFAEES